MTSETQEPVAEETKSAPVKKIEAPKPKPSVGKVFSALGLMLLEIILPALAAGGVLLWLFGGYNLWQIGKPTALVVFGIVMVVMSVILAAVLDTLTTPFRMSRGMKAVRFARDPRTRVVKLALGGLIIPIIVLVTLNLAPLASHGTVMNYLIAAAIPPVKLTPPDEVGAIAIRSENPSTRLLSIQVLQGFRSPEAMNQLVRLMMEDKGTLSDPALSDALIKAIAAYGATARDPLLASFKSVDPLKAGGSAGVSKDLYDRYFANSFDSLKTEITNGTTNQAARETQLAQLQVAQAQLKTSLTSLGYKPDAAAGGDPRLDFILQTFLAMDLKQDADLLTFAKATAADTRYSSQVRGDALLLVGKLGEQKDLDMLYPYLKSSDDVLLTRSLQAIAALQTRLSGAGSK